jgi:hypothetical protein
MVRLEHTLQQEAAFVIKGVQRDFPLLGVWECPPASKSPGAGGYRGLIESISSVLQIIRR